MFINKILILLSDNDVLLEKEYEGFINLDCKSECFHEYVFYNQ